MGATPMASGSLLRRVSAGLRRVPSLLWALLYLGCIPVFAGLYAWRPGEFYHSTVQHEPALARLRHTAELRMARAIEVNFRQKYSQGIRGATRVLRVDDVSVRLRPANDNAADGSPDFQFKVNGADMEAYLAAASPTYSLYRLDVSAGKIFALEPYVAFPCPSTLGEADAFNILSPQDPCLVIDRETSESIDKYLAGTRGLPIEGTTWDHYRRMLYFSAVTITTLGYGDIVPITAATRGLVTLEIILGPVLFGLFLNSLAGEAGSGSSPA